MEVVGITAFFLLIVIAAAIFSGYLLGRALARDRRYLLAVGELSLAPLEGPVEEETGLLLDEIEPVGTLALMLVYLMVLIGLWFAMFAILLQRS